ncbi:MAG TPA: ester cyclase [Flavisolibacter sp.]|jgi:predicted SnoaL-like aldol condensation-catalyzing enzyme|nr:ester cyclase [Flavisolibacter sp.]
MRKAYFLVGSIACLLTACNNDRSMLSSAHVDSLNRRVLRLTAVQKQEETNKKIVADFYQELFGDKNIAAIDKYLGDTYIQHNPVLADGKEALRKGVTEWFKGLPKEKIDIRHLNAEGDLVYLHTKAVENGATVSVIDIFRIDNGRIVEHWDVIQPVPAKSANPHPMF